MSVLVPSGRIGGGGVVLSRHPVPIVITPSSLVPVGMLACLFALYSSGARPLLLVGAAALGGVGGAISLIVHELGHVRAARRLKGVKPIRVSLLWLGAGTKFEGAYRSGRDQVRVAVAGPAASFAFAFLLLVAALMPMPRPLQYGLFGLSLLNVAIAIVSLVPVHPLDGHKLLTGLAWRLSGSEPRARAIIRRAGKAWLALEAVACSVLILERPLMGGLAVAIGSAFVLQKRLSSWPASLRRLQLRGRASG